MSRTAEEIIRELNTPPRARVRSGDTVLVDGVFYATVVKLSDSGRFCLCVQNGDRGLIFDTTRCQVTGRSRALDFAIGWETGCRRS